MSLSWEAKSLWVHYTCQRRGNILATVDIPSERLLITYYVQLLNPHKYGFNLQPFTFQTLFPPNPYLDIHQAQSELVFNFQQVHFSFLHLQVQVFTLLLPLISLMATIRVLDERGKVIEHSNNREWSKMYLCFMKNVEQVDDLIDYKHLEIVVFGS